MSNSKSKKINLGLLLILSLLTAFAPLSVDMYLPALPTILVVYGTNEANTQLTLSAFLFGFAIAQLVYGPLSDKFGRKPIIIIGITLYILSSAGAALTQNIESLIFLRFLQAIGASAGPVLARAIVRDLCEKNESAKILSLLMLIMGAAPMLAPIMGATILRFFSWETIFWFLCFFGVFCLIVTHLKLPETLPKNAKTQISIKYILTNYIELASNKKFIGYSLCSAFAFGGMFSYISGSSFFFINFFKLTPELFSLLFGINVISLMCGAAVNTALVKKFGSNYMLSVGTIISLIFGCALLLVSYLKLGGYFGIVITLFMFMPSVMIIGANATANALSIYKNKTGTSSALMGAIQFGIGAFSGISVGYLYDYSPFSMCYIISICGFLSFFSKLLLTKD